MSGLQESKVSYFQLLCIKGVKMTGRVPKHLAIIMDGNRRFAKKSAMNPESGHNKGYYKLLEAIEWCLHVGIPEVTVYAFSIENFKRSKNEVNYLYELAKDKIRKLLEDGDKLRNLGVRMHVVGQLSLFPEDITTLFSRLMLATRYNDKLRLNVACAYTGRNEMERAASILVQAVQNKKIEPEDIDEALVSQTMELGEPELLIRTSGEVRLSDFMLWQIANTVLYFSEVLWPEFSVYNLLAAIIHFRRYAPKATKTEELNEYKQRFIENLEAQRWNDVEKQSVSSS